MQSTTEAKYVAMTKVCKENIWLGRLVIDLGINSKMPQLHCDSHRSIQLERNPTFHANTKHIDVKYHFMWRIMEKK